MSGARDAFARLEAALAPLLTDQAIPHALRKQAAMASEAGDFIMVAERVIPLILHAEDAAENLAGIAKRLRAVMAEVMDETGCATLRGETHTASVSRGRAAVVITEPELVPKELLRQPAPQPDKAAIAKLLSSGKAVAGATLSNAGPQLTIRAKDK